MLSVQSGDAPADVRLLRVLGDDLQARLDRRSDGGTFVPGAFRKPQVLLDEPDYRVVLHVPGGDDHDVTGAVVAGDVGVGRRGARPAAGLSAPEDRPTDGMVAPQRRCEEVVDLVVWGVLVARDLLEDDLALRLTGVLGHQRVRHHVGQRLDRGPDIGVQHARVVAGVLLAGERVEFGAHAVEGLGDLRRCALRRALEHHVLDEVRHAGFVRRFVAAADSGPDPDGHRTHGVDALTEDGDAGGGDAAVVEGLAHVCFLACSLVVVQGRRPGGRRLSALDRVPPTGPAGTSCVRAVVLVLPARPAVAATVATATATVRTVAAGVVAGGLAGGRRGVGLVHAVQRDLAAVVDVEDDDLDLVSH